jgi:hypothetical protein
MRRILETLPGENPGKVLVQIREGGLLGSILTLPYMFNSISGKTRDKNRRHSLIPLYLSSLTVLKKL